jgi:16S rRNA (adenine1518-N6/adenine1519-N6)-dimethyltransferase
LTGGAAFRPKKSLGQNFLIDQVHRARIVAAGELSRADAVLEIGAGDGSLTALIAAQAGRVVAVELDGRLIAGLRERFEQDPHVAIVQGDILDVEVGELMARYALPHPAPVAPEGGQVAPYKVIANLPYYITSHAIRRLLESPNPPSLMVLTVQREVGERIASAPPRMSLPALSAQFYCRVEVIDRIPAGAFRPRPKVDSAVLRLERRREPLLPGVSAEEFFGVARAGFHQPRKQLRNSLAAGLKVSPEQAAGWLTDSGISPQRRAETLSMEEWGRLAAALAEPGLQASAGEARLGSGSSRTRSR